MKFLSLAVTATAASALRLRSDSSVTPVQKVLELLKGMHSTGEKAKHEEEINFSAFKEWCENTVSEKSREVQEETALIEQLVADIQKFESDATQLGREIQAHEADIGGWDTDLKDATDIRNAEAKDFALTHKDYSESIDAIERALATIKKQNYNREQAAVLLQKISSLSKVPESSRRVIAAFLAQNQDPLGLAYDAPQAHGYEFQSGGVIDLLEKLLEKFEDERNTLEKEEANSHHAFDMLEQDLRNQIATATEQRNNKSGEKAGKEQAAANAKSDLSKTTVSRDSNQKFLDETTAQCQTKNQEFASRQKLRTDELSAVQQAIDLIANIVAPNADKHLPTLLQKSVMRRGVSLLQTSKTSQKKDVQDRVSSFLAQAAVRIGSKALSQIALKVSEDPFVKVKQMIQDLVVRLMEEANQEAEHKGWCDTELKSNDLTRKQRTAEVEALTAEIDELTANINKLGQEVIDITQAITDLDTDVAKYTENRNKEAAINAETIKDTQESQTAVAQALTILKEFYSKAATATALATVGTSDQPITWDKPYTGLQGSNGNVVNFLEVIQSDFARLETETKADEAQAAKDYSKFMNDAAVNKAGMSKDVEYKTDKKATLTGTREERIQDRDGSQKELDAALAYFDKLKPACIESGVTYEDRVGRREDEIKSLQEALRILNGEDIPTSFLAFSRSAALRRVRA